MGKGEVRYAELRDLLVAMEKTFCAIPNLAVHTSIHKPCKDIASAGQKLIKALGVLSVACPLGGPVPTETYPERIDRLLRMDTLSFHFLEVISECFCTPVTFGPPAHQNGSFSFCPPAHQDGNFTSYPPVVKKQVYLCWMRLN
ncbi:hypothetical protein E2562_032486, partial [Oryza meyeriana var. granulata]